MITTHTTTNRGAHVGTPSPLGEHVTPAELKELRHRLGHDQQTMAKAVGCGLSTYARWEQRKDLDDPIPMLPVYAQALLKLKRKADRQERHP